MKNRLGARVCAYTVMCDCKATVRGACASHCENALL